MNIIHGKTLIHRDDLMRSIKHHMPNLRGFQTVVGNPSMDEDGNLVVQYYGTDDGFDPTGLADKHKPEWARLEPVSRSQKGVYILMGSSVDRWGAVHADGPDEGELLYECTKPEEAISWAKREGYCVVKRRKPFLCRLRYTLGHWVAQNTKGQDFLMRETEKDLRDMLSSLNYQVDEAYC